MRRRDLLMMSPMLAAIGGRHWVKVTVRVDGRLKRGWLESRAVAEKHYRDIMQISPRGKKKDDAARDV